jgi:3-phenylpropionate/trans-cinnamate dioxygenase ferredoxin reductase subunit
VVQIDCAAHDLVLGDGRRLRYDRLLLATGASARRLPVLGGSAVRYLRTHGDATALRERLDEGARVGVIGAGFIGLEVAASARTRGAAVTVFENAPAALTRIVPSPIAEVIAERHRSAGVELRCGVQVRHIAVDDGVTRITTNDGTVTAFEDVVAGIGSVPATDLAERAGLPIENGIVVDTYLRTADHDVFAAGDCCAFPHPLFDGRRVRLESWRNARDQGAAAAYNMLDRAQPYDAVPWFWSDHYELTLQIAGLPSVADREVVRERPDGVTIRFGITEQGRLVSASAVGIGNAVAKDIRVAEMLIAKRAFVEVDALRDPAIGLKQLLRQPDWRPTTEPLHA